MPRLTQSQRDTAVDNQKWESAALFVASASALQHAIKEHGLMSREVKLAQAIADAKLKEYKKCRLK